jgi:hypothetical protein
MLLNLSPEHCIALCPEFTDLVSRYTLLRDPVCGLQLQYLQTSTASPNDFSYIKDGSLYVSSSNRTVLNKQVKGDVVPGLESKPISVRMVGTVTYILLDTGVVQILDINLRTVQLPRLVRNICSFGYLIMEDYTISEQYGFSLTTPTYKFICPFLGGHYYLTPTGVVLYKSNMSETTTPLPVPLPVLTILETGSTLLMVTSDYNIWIYKTNTIVVDMWTDPVPNLRQITTSNDICQVGLASGDLGFYLVRKSGNVFVLDHESLDLRPLHTTHKVFPTERSGVWCASIPGKEGLWKVRF